MVERLDTRGVGNRPLIVPMVPWKLALGLRSRQAGSHHETMILALLTQHRDIFNDSKWHEADTERKPHGVVLPTSG